jgi:hypothetical protein
MPVLLISIDQPILLRALTAKNVHAARKEALLVMQSSAGVAGRALIMLACVVGIPALAMSGTSWSELLKKFQDFRWQSILDGVSASTSTSTTATDEAQRSATSNPSAIPTTGFAHTTASGDSSLAPAWQGQSVGAANSGVVPAAYQAPADLSTGGPTASAPAGQKASAATPLGSDAFHTIQDRLRELGATYYLLESWGNQQQMYRFYCRMAIGGNPNYTHYFEAMESDPLQAMHQVLRQVESWHQGGMALGGK